MLAARSLQPQVAQIGPEFDVLRRLDHGHPPLRLLVEDRPVERMAAAVADDAGVKDQARMGLPDVARDHLGEHRREDQVGSEPLDRGAHPGPLDAGRDAHDMAAGGEFDMGMLGQTVIGARQQ